VCRGAPATQIARIANVGVLKRADGQNTTIAKHTMNTMNSFKIPDFVVIVSSCAS